MIYNAFNLDIMEFSPINFSKEYHLKEFSIVINWSTSKAVIQNYPDATVFFVLWKSCSENFLKLPIKITLRSHFF